MKKRKAGENNKEYVFRVALNTDHPFCEEQDIRGEVYRDVAILDSFSLYDFAESIVDAFGFNFDHSFGFFNNLENWVKSTEKYELFADMEDQGIEPVDSKSVEKTKINQVFKNKGDKMLFLFDYGDNWEFIVELKDIKALETKKSYPFVVKSSGVAPEQYPSFEDEE